MDLSQKLALKDSYKEKMILFVLSCSLVCLLLFFTRFIHSSFFTVNNPIEQIEIKQIKAVPNENVHTVKSDLKINRDDAFINKITQIQIPQFPLAYNATIIKDGDGYLMAFRHDEYPLPIKEPLIWSEFYQFIGFIRLNARFEPVGDATICKKLGNRAYDPRLFRIEDQLYLSYTSPLPESTSSVASSRIYLSKVDLKGKEIDVDNPLLLETPFPTPPVWEKNWVPFNFQQKLALGYLINPHTVLIPSLADGKCQLASIAKTVSNFEWDWGSIRGGTPALKIDGEYLAIFHSCKIDPDTKLKLYYVGAYTFQSEPPFQLTKISPRPFLHHDFYSSPPRHIISGPFASYVLFPAGIVEEKDKIFVCYGENDVGIKVMELDKKKLYDSLIPLP